MTTEPNPIDLRAAIVDALLHATMDDGTPISSRVKAQTIVDHLGITDCPLVFLQIIARGISQKLRRDRSREEHDRGARQAED